MVIFVIMVSGMAWVAVFTEPVIMDNYMESEKKVCVSVVVPVYNSEDTIGGCIESVLRQSFRDFELILVNDGSRDGSGRICDEYLEKDKRVSVIHQPNMGRTAARAAGVGAARGEWICFVDSDDMLLPDGLADLWEKTGDETDIVFGNGKSLAGENRDFVPVDEFRHLAVRGEGTIGVPWGSLYRKSIVTPYTLNLPRDIINGEDYIYWLRIVFLTDKPVRILYKSVYDKGADHTSNCFVWTAEYAYRLNEFRKSSIPSDVRSLFLRDMVEDRLVNLYAVAICRPKKEWVNSEFYIEIMHDMDVVGMRPSWSKRVFFMLPGRLFRRAHSYVGEILKEICG